MLVRSLEVRYDIASIPEMTPGDVDRALDFRDAAIELIEDALLEAGAGEWEGAGIGRGEIRFAFMVDDFDAAEAIVRRVVADTPYANVGAITRASFDTAKIAAPALH